MCKTILAHGKMCYPVKHSRKVLADGEKREYETIKLLIMTTVNCHKRRHTSGPEIA